MKRIISGILLMLACTLSWRGTALAGVNLPVGHWAYDAMEKLEAEGVIRSSLLSTKPITREEAARLALEAKENLGEKGGRVRRIVEKLLREFSDEISADEKTYLKPVDKVTLEYGYQQSGRSSYNKNRDGYELKEGNNLRADMSVRGAVPHLQLAMTPEIRTDLEKAKAGFRSLYGVVELPGADLLIGKDSQRWGPGRNGAILLSNNAEPFTMLKLANSTPALLPWILRYLGPFRFVLFATRLEKERTVPEPYLWGMRIDIKPLPYLELGAARTALLGGEGRKANFGTWWRSLTSRGENESEKEPGDQRAGWDARIILPFRVQPLVLYIERAGEDEAGGLPTKWATLTGLYLPRIVSFDWLELRAEYANTRIKRQPGIWYTHHIYRSGYTYKDRIIGHYIGADSEDFYISLKIFTPAGDLTGELEREKHYGNADASSTTDFYTLTWEKEFKGKFRLALSGSYTKTEAETETAGLVSLSVSF